MTTTSPLITTSPASSRRELVAARSAVGAASPQQGESPTAWARRTAIAQGLSGVVTDASFLRRIAHNVSAGVLAEADGRMAA